MVERVITRIDVSHLLSMIASLVCCPQIHLGNELDPIHLAPREKCVCQMEVSDMCIPDNPMIKNTVDDIACFDENTWETWDLQLVREAEKAEIARFKKMCVYYYVSRSEALNDPDGSFVKVKWVRRNKGTAAQPNIRCPLVATRDRVRATDQRTLVRKIFADVDEDGHRTCSQGRRAIMVMEVKCAFLCGGCRRRIYIELPRQDPKHGTADLAGLLQKSMYGTRDAPQIWAKEVQKVMEGLHAWLKCL